MINENEKDIYILAIESSCDETCASVVKNGREVLSSVISTQIEIHKRFGGVVPEIASRNHTLAVTNVVDEAMQNSGLELSQIDAIAVTYGAGLVGALLAGLSFAKALAYALKIPLIPVNHIRGHIAANYIEDKTLEPPFICLVASGGHTAILKITSYTTHEFLGGTFDDAAGEAFDKVAKVLGLPYPGGPSVSKLALEGKPTIELPKMLKADKGFNFSYSGLKTAVINYVHTQNQKGIEINKADVCASFQIAAIDVLVEKAIRACVESGISTVAIAGGVGANDYLRTRMTEEAKKFGLKLVLPQKVMCTDNACMIGSEGFIQFKNNNVADLSLNAAPSLKL
ncbi:MAG: tRNA (adenosine(37)-N6)-threonylcarbamoyltransferase complex transferase subunit TsaD [Clostridia bacterium]